MPSTKPASNIPNRAEIWDTMDVDDEEKQHLLELKQLIGAKAVAQTDIDKLDVSKTLKFDTDLGGNKKYFSGAQENSELYSIFFYRKNSRCCLT